MEVKTVKQPGLIYFAKVLSVIFHPGFILWYFLLLLFLINPFLFGLSTPKEKGIIIFYVFILSVIFPLVPVVMMYALGMSKSITLSERTERIVPLALTGIFYLWIYINFLNNSDIPVAYSIFVLGSVISLFTCFFINLFEKISLHAAGVSGLLTGLIITRIHFAYDHFSLRINESLVYSINTNTIIIIAVILCGLVGTSRLILKSHKSSDIYIGYFVGILGQIIAMRALLY